MQSTDQATIEVTSPESGSTVSSYLDISGTKVHYKTCGAGEQLLLLHGWGGSIESIAIVLDSLAKFYKVFAIDFPGHGKSDLPPLPWSVSDYTECLVRIMDTLGLEQPHILAHSFGGRVTIRLANLYPGRVNRIILVDSSGIRPARPPKYYFKVALAKVGKLLARYGGGAGHGVRNLIYSRIGSKDYANAGALRETFVRVVNEDQTDLLPRVKSPTLLVWGAEDKETPLASARRMEKLIPNASLVVLENAGHFPYLDQPIKFNLIVRKFLRDSSR